VGFDLGGDVKAHSLVEKLRNGCKLSEDEPIPELVVLTGYVGESVTAPGVKDGERWTLFYRDVSLTRWVLLRECDIAYRKPVSDPGSILGDYEVIWLKRDVLLKSGSTPLSAQALFLSGAFTTAGDLEAAPRGGTFAPPDTGPWCAVACTPKSTRG